MDVLAVLIYTFTLLFIVRDIKWRIFLLSTLILITAFNYVGYGYSARHLGTYVFAWIAAVWFSKTQSAPLPEHKSVRYLLNGIFVCQAIAGIYAYVMTMAYPFSSGKEIAGFIEQKKWNSENIVGYQDFTASTVAGYLNRPIYYPERHQSATFMVWNKEKKWGLENRDLENELIHSMELNPGKRTLLITNPLLTMKFEVLDYTLLKDSREPIVGDEWLRLYEIKHR